MKITRKAIAQVMESVLEDYEVRQATLFLSPDFIVKATRQMKPDRREKSWTVVFTFGKPNFRQREFVRMCQKAGEPFPVKKIQLKFYP